MFSGILNRTVTVKLHATQLCVLKQKITEQYIPFNGRPGRQLVTRSLGQSIQDSKRCCASIVKQYSILYFQKPLALVFMSFYYFMSVDIV